MSDSKYSIMVMPEVKLVEVRFTSSVNFSLMENVMSQLRDYIAENYRIKLVGYINKECNYIRAFMLALSLFGDKNRVILENRARYNKSERRKRRMQVRELRDRGYSVKQISEELNVPLKTVYRWLRREPQ
ncbi:MAG: helix-turn-helix domain-containing protein [Candidatus Bathyarchaeia archaeon]